MGETGLLELQERYRRFLEARDWDEFHTPKNVATSLSIETGELLEVFQWKDNFDADEIQDDDELVEAIKDEIADIVIYSMSMAIMLDLDLREVVAQKMDHNDERYDVETAQEMNREMWKWKR